MFRIGLIVIGAIALWCVGLVLFERFVPRSVLRAYQKHVGGPMFRTSAGIVPGWAVIETVGRRTGLTRRVPIGGRLRGDSYWLVAGDGRADFVRNIEADARVRLRVHGRWRTGTAHVLPDDDPRRRLRHLNPVNSLFIGLAAKDLVTVRIDLVSRRRDARALLAALDGCDGHDAEDVGRVRELARKADPWSQRTPLHVTGSALILHPASARVLLRWHARQQAWIQVGGHADDGEDDPWTVALREAIEETGLTDLAHWPPGRDPKPVQVTIVPVPASRDEPAHEHADVRYLLSTDHPELATAESDAAPLRWLHVDEAFAQADEENVRTLLARVKATLSPT